MESILQFIWLRAPYECGEKLFVRPNFIVFHMVQLGQNGMSDQPTIQHAK